uniref:Uncharacterized protein n=1 Tax=Aplanochytrium stocchinoi TaxID=215587 RepID=A0A7S3PK02_9STRA
MAPNNTRVPEMKMIMDKEEKLIVPKDAHRDDEAVSSIEDLGSKDVESDDIKGGALVESDKVAEPEPEKSDAEAKEEEPNSNAEDATQDIQTPPPNINPGTIPEVCLQVLRHNEGRYMRPREVLDATDVWHITAKNRVQSVGYALLSLSKGGTIKRKKEGGAVSYCLETEGTDGARDTVQVQGQTPHLTTQEIVLTVLYFNQDRHMTAEQVYRATDMWNLTSAMPVPSVARVLRNLCTKELVTNGQPDGIGAYKIKKGATFSLVKYTLSKESK